MAVTKPVRTPSFRKHQPCLQERVPTCLTEELNSILAHPLEGQRPRNMDPKTWQGGTAMQWAGIHFKALGRSCPAVSPFEDFNIYRLNGCD